jgi:hypothetical protein
MTPSNTKTHLPRLLEILKDRNQILRAGHLER